MGHNLQTVQFYTKVGEWDYESLFAQGDELLEAVDYYCLALTAVTELAKLLCSLRM
jgi:hypothetical protein